MMKEVTNWETITLMFKQTISSRHFSQVLSGQGHCMEINNCQEELLSHTAHINPLDAKLSKATNFLCIYIQSALIK